MKKGLVLLLFFLINKFLTISVSAQCHFIPSTSLSVDTVVYSFTGGNFASYGCAPIDPTFWLSGNGISVTCTFVMPQDHPAIRVWGMNDDDSAEVMVNSINYYLDTTGSASYAPKVICGVSPGPDGVIFQNGKIVGANSNGAGNYSYSDVTINMSNVTTIQVTSISGAGWGFAGVVLDCAIVPAAGFTATPTSVCPGTCIDFTNLSQNATSYTWSFAGALPPLSTDVNPATICYNTPGSYDVTLIASNGTIYDTLTLNNFITVFPYPAPQGILQNGDTLFANAGAVSYQWYHDGNLIQGATDYYYVAPEGGNYNVVATDNNGCEVEAVIFDVVAGTGMLDASAYELRIFPNPVSDILSVRISSSGILKSKIKIINASGEEIPVEELSHAGNELLFNVSNLSPGIYFVEMTDSQKNFHTRFIKALQMN